MEIAKPHNTVWADLHSLVSEELEAVVAQHGRPCTDPAAAEDLFVEQAVAFLRDRPAAQTLLERVREGIAPAPNVPDDDRRPGNDAT